MDERLRPAKRPVRHQAGRREPSQYPEATARRADLAHARRSADRLSRIRPRTPRNVFKREISAVQRNERAARLRRVSIAGKRDVGDLAGSAKELRETLQDR